MKKILLLNGPNLSTLGLRKTEIYGHTTLSEIEKTVQDVLKNYNIPLVAIQSNAESDLISTLENFRETLGAIVNPGALMMCGWSLRDALEDYPSPWIEVHISNIYARESFRHSSILSPLASGIICGLGAYGYVAAVNALLNKLNIS